MASTDNTYTAKELLSQAETALATLDARGEARTEIEGEVWVWLEEAKLYYQFEGANEGWTLTETEYEELLQDAWREAQLA